MSNIYHSEPPTQGKAVIHTNVGDVDIELWSKEVLIHVYKKDSNISRLHWHVEISFNYHWKDTMTTFPFIES